MKPINITAFSDKLREQFELQLHTLLNSKAVCNDKLSLTLNVPNLLAEQHKEKKQVYFTPEAWLKMFALTDLCKVEITMNGVSNKSNGSYIISDILVPPQEVTGVTAKATDDYGPWLMGHSDDVFNNIRFQVHSHVNMGCAPSGTDEAFFMDMLAMVNDYYIFMIVNKKGEHHIRVYDVEQNIMYENTDIEVNILLADGTTLKPWAQKLFDEQVILPPPAPAYTSPVYPTVIYPGQNVHRLTDPVYRAPQYYNHTTKRWESEAK